MLSLLSGCSSHTKSDPVLDTADDINLLFRLVDNESKLNGPEKLSDSPAVNDNIIQSLKYQSTTPEGTPVEATGKIVMSKEFQGSPRVILYFQGTNFESVSLTQGLRDPYITQSDDRITESFFVRDTTIVVAVEYFKKRNGDTSTPADQYYLDKKMEANAGFSALKAAEVFFKAKNINWDGSYSVLGFSQGGHAALALAESNTSPFKLRAVAAISGPYDLSGSTVNFYLNGEKKSPFSIAAAGLFLTTLTAPENPLFTDLSFASKFRKPVKDEDDDLIKDMPTQLPLTDVARTELISGHLHELIKENDVIHGIIHAPVRLVVSKNDEVVPYQNTDIAKKTLEKDGTPVTVDELKEEPTQKESFHARSFPRALQGIKKWFNKQP